jgi:hypothetical protein
VCRNLYTPAYKKHENDITEVLRWKLFVAERKGRINEIIAVEGMAMELIMCTSLPPLRTIVCPLMAFETLGTTSFEQWEI